MKKFQILIPDDIHKKIKIEAARINMTMSGYIMRSLLDKLLQDRHGRERDD